MRFLYYDRVLTAVKGERLVASKAVALSEEFLPEHFARRAVMPSSLLVEAMAQAAGWLINLSADFRRSAIISLVEGARMGAQVEPGALLRTEATLLEMTARWAHVRCAMTQDSQQVASVERLTFVLRTISDPDEVVSETGRFGYFSGWSSERIEQTLEVR